MRLCQIHHPDKGGCATKFAQLQEAYEVPVNALLDSNNDKEMGIHPGNNQLSGCLTGSLLRVLLDHLNSWEDHIFDVKYDCSTILEISN